MNVLDLDILRPEPRIVKIGGKEIDVSFVPTGITFDLDGIMQELIKIDAKKIKTDPEMSKRAFDLGVKLCVVYSEHKYRDMNEEWFRNNTSSAQIEAFAKAIQEALIASYSGIGDHAKN